mmetsp:Transcript_78602/g.163364  ORF Transcript_78602/g.163364 Transcript_78602/m.163364 type:complete len:573 (-) Transcript_78602:202-1920(-)|eukprot:CAMPEP_0206457294 /NCGR_PEP_ID=MMETSP0324_2-20121206/22876_1 /ASSEMBLY_ACC=CAM_ASM_000836 /TAXON_ID=2866 /ORGANISM="Crypthecodinium cohnii, Strain Seligo" /LENGTH=572 /DNA_ID=CAMNT_0053928389 /DNA_START=12 /DNA_END=1730 /DNA_ORIENTATION=+
MSVASTFASTMPTRTVGISRQFFSSIPAAKNIFGATPSSAASHRWSRLSLPLARQINQRGFSYRVLGSGPPTASRTPTSEDDDGTGVFEAECLVDRLGVMAHDRVDLEKLRFKRILKDILRDRAGWVLPTLVQTVLALEKHPSALESPAVDVVLQRLVAGLSLTSEGLEKEDLAGILLQLAQARLYPGSGSEALLAESSSKAGPASPAEDEEKRSEKEEDDQEEWLTALRPKVRPRIEGSRTLLPQRKQAKAKAKATATAAATASANESALLPSEKLPNRNDEISRAQFQALFWKQLLPQVMEDAQELTLRRKVDLLFALCTAWESFPENESLLQDEGLKVSISRLAMASWEQAAPLFLSHQQHPEVASLSRLLLCLGTLSQFRVFESEGEVSSTRLATLISRTLKVDLFSSASVPRLLEVHLGLEGLGLNSTAPRHGRAVQRLISSHLQGASGATGGMQNHELVEALLLLRSVGRLTAEEPVVLPLLQRATNSVDSLNRGERMVLRGLLSMLARDAKNNLDDTKVVLGSSEDDRLSSASSAVATICRLEHLDWFSRKPRAQVSWWKCRGAF